MLIFSLILSALLVVSGKRILIISDTAESTQDVAKMIRSINSENDSIEEVNDRIPVSILNADNEPIYDTIYNLKAASSATTEPQIKWRPEEVSNFVQKGGNFFTTAAISEKILNDFGVEFLEGEIESVGDDEVIGSAMNHQHAFASFGIKPDLKISRVFKLRNDPKMESNYNALIQSAMSLPAGSSICPKSPSAMCSSSSQSISLLATMESRTGSRFMAVTSLKLAQRELFEWVQGAAFNIKIGSIAHELSTGKGGNRGKTELESTIYRTNDRINVRLCLIDGGTGGPFQPSDPTDFQFELKMMNIQLRKSFDSAEGGCLSVDNVQLPPKPAVYTLRISHNRPGWSQLSWEERILIRPFRHNEFARFIPVAFPYYASWIGILVGSFFILLPSLFKQVK